MSNESNKMKKSFGGIVLDSSFRIIIPFTLVYGMYILTHGEYSRAAVSRRGHCWQWVSFWCV